MAGARKALILCVMLLIATHSSSASDSNYSEVFEEDTFFSSSQSMIWSDDTNDTHIGQIYYPATEEGSGKPIDNTSGPYPVLIWIGDDGEANDQYDWLGQHLATSGYITIVLPPDWNSAETQSQCVSIIMLWYRLEYNHLNGSFEGDPPNMRDAFDLEHWGIGGHGLGAKQAAQCQLIMAGAWREYVTIPLPTALVALGLENANTDIPDSSFGPSPEPGMGLYLTGTLDNIAKANTNVEQWLDDQQIPWHYMSVIGANHVQYKDENTGWDWFNDGSSDMNRTYQQEHASNHIRPYLDLMLKGEHEQWLQATNRESNWQSPSDSDAYIYEDLTGARFMPMDANISDISESDGSMGRFVSVSTTLTHRNGGLPIGTTVLCTIEEGGDWWDPADYADFEINSTGVFTSSIENGTKSSTYCEVSTEGVPPGNRSIRIDVDWYGMPSYLEIDFYRENRVPVQVSPLPSILVPQHGMSSLPFSDFIVDPDGITPIVDMLPHLPNTNQMHCYLESPHITCEHTGLPEWSGTETLNLTIRDRYDSTFVTQLNLSAVVVPVDDSVIQISDLPSVQIAEDGDEFVYNFTSYFEDPEGANVTIVNASSPAGIDVSWTVNNVALNPILNWHGNTTVEVFVSDGTSTPISSIIDVEITPVPDAPRINLTRVSVVEDTPLEIPLTELGWDEDGDALEFEISGSHPHISVTVLTSVLRIVPSSDWSGLSTGWNLTVTSHDGSLTAPIEIDVSEVNDPVQLTWGPLESPLDVEFIVAIHDPDDSSPWMMQIRWDGLVWSEFEADCPASDPSALNPKDWECKVVVGISELQPGAHRLEARVLENGNWTEPKTYYHTIPIPTTDSEGEEIIPIVDVNSGDGLASPWVVFAIVVGAVVALIGLYMIITLSKDDMEKMLDSSNSRTNEVDEDEFADLESELVEFD
ncbi:MAG: hypothetical protein CMB52_04235 [Euryarchaeota archaeon]|nr:hypothetical protein [Euryarchaeota archaeon]